jgi:hypothetical protein
MYLQKKECTNISNRTMVCHKHQGKSRNQANVTASMVSSNIPESGKRDGTTLQNIIKCIPRHGTDSPWPETQRNKALMTRKDKPSLNTKQRADKQEADRKGQCLRVKERT